MVTTLLGYAAIVLLLGLGMAFAIERMERATTSQLQEIRKEELELTLSERVRWNAELTVAQVRGYLISKDPKLLDEVQSEWDEFEKSLYAIESTIDSPGAPLIADVKRAADQLRRIQSEIAEERERSAGLDAIVARFDNELLPARRALSRALDRLNDHVMSVVDQGYLDVEEARSSLAAAIYGDLAILVLIGFAMAAYFTRTLSRAYRRETDALEAARRALAARDEVTGIVAHDLRTPLGTIMLTAALLADQTSDEHARDRANSIEKIAARMELLIKTLLDVATIEAGRLTITVAPCDVDGLVRETIALFESKAAAKRIRLESNVAERGLIVRADHERIVQALSNLVENAVEFTLREGRVTLTVTRDGGAARFVVSDTGPGIEPGTIPHLFDRFWHHETRGVKGTGLGLFIVKSIVDAHGGTIHVESKRGTGATFAFTLELAEPGARAAPTEDAVSPPGAL